MKEDIFIEQLARLLIQQTEYELEKKEERIKLFDGGSIPSTGTLSPNDQDERIIN